MGLYCKSFKMVQDRNRSYFATCAIFLLCSLVLTKPERCFRTSTRGIYRNADIVGMKVIQRFLAQRRTKMTGSFFQVQTAVGGAELAYQNVSQSSHAPDLMSVS